jgi:hypothetical protein
VNRFCSRALDIGQRLIALFVATALPAITGGALIGVGVAQSALMAGFLAVAGVLQRLSALSVDGHLSAADITEAFSGKSTSEPVKKVARK